MAEHRSLARVVPVALTFLLSASTAAAQEGDASSYDDSDARACVRMSCGTSDTNGTSVQGETEPMAPDQVQGDEPDDFEFESPREPFGQEQTEGDEPDDFEFEPE